MAEQVVVRLERLEGLPFQERFEIQHAHLASKVSSTTYRDRTRTATTSFTGSMGLSPLLTASRAAPVVVWPPTGQDLTIFEAHRRSVFPADCQVRQLDTSSDGPPVSAPGSARVGVVDQPVDVGLPHPGRGRRVSGMPFSTAQRTDADGSRWPGGQYWWEPHGIIGELSRRLGSSEVSRVRVAEDDRRRAVRDGGTVRQRCPAG